MTGAGSGFPVLALALAALTAAGDDPGATRIAPEAFRAYAEGTTLFFAEQGGEDALYGAEQYLAGGKVIWQDSAGRCVRGVWIARDDDLCFTYADDPRLTLCWGFWRDAAGLFARLVGSPQDERLRVVAQSPRPVQCAAPGAGV